MLIKDKEIENEYITLYSLQKKKIGIPIFQRFYAWKEVQTRQLLEDIASSIKSDKQLYLLDFIYYIEDRKIMLADGQQRIVTINLLIKAINEVISENDLLIDPIDPFDIEYDIVENNNKYHDAYDNLIKAPFRKVYLHLLDFVNEHIHEIACIRDIIMNNIYIYFKKCSNADDAFSIFQQINTGGKPLSKDEIIKTALDQYSVIYDIKIDTLNIKTVRQDLISYYKYKQDDYNANFDNMTIMSFLKKYVTCDKTAFKEFKESIDTLDKIRDNSFGSIIQYINRPSLYDIMNVLSMTGIDLKNNNKYVKHVMLPLCFASVTLTFKGGNPVLFKYLSTELIKKIKNNATVNELEIYIAEFIDKNSNAFKLSLNEFNDFLGNTVANFQNIKKALLIMDVVNKNVSGDINVSSINLEHIYPQKPEHKWAIMGWPMNYDEQQNLINSIGNYLLLNEEINKTIKNKYITDKVTKYKEIIPHDLILQTDVNTVDFEEFENEKDEYIIKRQYRIAKLLKTTLPFGEILITNKSQE